MREKQYRSESVDAQLQLYNVHLISAIEEGVPCEDYVAAVESIYAPTCVVAVCSKVGKLYCAASAHPLVEKLRVESMAFVLQLTLHEYMTNDAIYVWRVYAMATEVAGTT
jgi:hypothetical protein